MWIEWKGERERERARGKKRRILGGGEIRRVNIPPVEAPFMVKLRTNDRVSMVFSGTGEKRREETEKEERRRRKREEEKKKKEKTETGARGKERLSFPKSDYDPRVSRENESEQREEREKKRKREKAENGREGRVGRNGKRHADALCSRRVES